MSMRRKSRCKSRFLWEPTLAFGGGAAMTKSLAHTLVAGHSRVFYTTRTDLDGITHRT